MRHLSRLLSLPTRRPWLFLGVLLLGLSLGFGGVQAAAYLRYHRHLRAAEEASARYDFEPAHEHLAACLRWRPDDPALLLLAARTARQAGLLDEAEQLLTRYSRQTRQPTPEGRWSGRCSRHRAENCTSSRKILLARLQADDPKSNLILEALRRRRAKLPHRQGHDSVCTACCRKSRTTCRPCSCVACCTKAWETWRPP